MKRAWREGGRNEEDGLGVTMKRCEDEEKDGEERQPPGSSFYSFSTVL